MQDEYKMRYQDLVDQKETIKEDAEQIHKEVYELEKESKEVKLKFAAMIDQFQSYIDATENAYEQKIRKMEIEHTESFTQIKNQKQELEQKL